jgi:transcriptional regulator with XRE-family HTH domain
VITFGRSLGGVDDRAELSGFLRSRRARLRPADVGLRDHGGGRRVPGLRREELAVAAGVSIAHYTRLEQGRGGSVSDEVLDAVGAALRLDDDELVHLHRIARRPPACESAPPEVPPGMRHLLDSFTLTPALVLGRHTQILGWNALAAAVFGDFAAVPEHRRTVTHLLFGEHRALYGPGWEAAATRHAAHLRVLLGRHRGDPGLSTHVTDMLERNPHFARLWAAHPVARARSAVHILHHPVAGALTLHHEVAALPEGPACCGLDLYAAEPGSASERALRALGAC